MRGRFDGVAPSGLGFPGHGAEPLPDANYRTQAEQRAGAAMAERLQPVAMTFAHAAAAEHLGPLVATSAAMFLEGAEG
jgi:hypothetical protein